MNISDFFDHFSSEKAEYLPNNIILIGKIKLQIRIGKMWIKESI